MMIGIIKLGRGTLPNGQGGGTRVSMLDNNCNSAAATSISLGYFQLDGFQSERLVHFDRCSQTFFSAPLTIFRIST